MDREDQTECDICRKTFRNRNALKRHSKRHGTKTLSCDICGKPFFRKDELSQHIHGTHSDETPHICDECGFRFKSRASLCNHKNLLHLHIKYKCSVCDKQFSNKQNKSVHEKSHQEKSKCNICQKVFIHLEKHQKRCHKPAENKGYECVTCGMKFAEPRYLREHCNSKHGPHRYTCPLCPASFAYRSGLRNHKAKCKK